MAKTGRKAQHYRDPETGKEIHGLGRRPSKPGKPGRFYAIFEQNKTFGSAPKAAIIKYEAYQRKTRGERPLLVCGMDKVVRDIGGNGTVLSGNNGNGTVHVPDRETLTRILKVGDDFQRVPDTLKPMIMGLQAHEEYWPQYAEERGLDPELPFEGYWPDYIYWLIGRWIKSEPDDAAQKLGIPQLKNLDAIKSPPPSLRLSEIAKLYQEKADLSLLSKRRGARMFKEFVRTVEVKTVKEIGASRINAYRLRTLDQCDAKGFTPHWTHRRFSMVKTMLSHALKMGQDQDELNRVLGLCKMLEAPKRLNCADSMPITRGELEAILANADDLETAIVLLSLNCGFYMIDVCRIPESAVDLARGHVIFPRIKVGKPIPRVAMLWQRTIDALIRLRERHPHTATDADGNTMLFANKIFGKRLQVQALRSYWSPLRAKAQVPALQFCQLRDGAYTAAIEAGIDITHCEILLGHSIGTVKDAYLKRRPDILASACAAIENHYFG